MVFILADHGFLHTYGELTIWLAAVTVAMGALSRLRPIKWVWRRLVTTPITEWGERVVRDQVEFVVDERLAPEFRENGGRSLKDKIDKAVQGQQDIKDRQDRFCEVLTDHGDRLTSLEGSITTLGGEIRSRLGDITPTTKE